jgi:hypothetical protein
MKYCGIELLNSITKKRTVGMNLATRLIKSLKKSGVPLKTIDVKHAVGFQQCYSLLKPPEQRLRDENTRANEEHIKAKVIPHIEFLYISLKR